MKPNSSPPFYPPKRSSLLSSSSTTLSSKKSKRLPQPNMFFPQSYLLRSLVRSQHLLPVAVFLLSFCFLPISVASDEEGSAYEWDADQYPNLNNKNSAKFCTGRLRNPPSFICDPDELLTRQEANDLDKLIRSSDNITLPCLCEPCPPNPTGLNITIALLTSVKIKMNQTLDETIEHFAQRTRSNWNYSPLCHNDLVIFVAHTYNRIYISMGAKAERVIGSSTARDLIKNNMNHFKYGHVYLGLESIIKSLKREAQDYDPRFDKLGLKQGLVITIVAGIASLLVVSLLVWFCMRREARRTKAFMAANGGGVERGSIGITSGGVKVGKDTPAIETKYQPISQRIISEENEYQ